MTLDAIRCFEVARGSDLKVFEGESRGLLDRIQLAFLELKPILGFSHPDQIKDSSESIITNLRVLIDEYEEKFEIAKKSFKIYSRFNDEELMLFESLFSIFSDHQVLSFYSLHEKIRLKFSDLKSFSGVDPATLESIQKFDGLINVSQRYMSTFEKLISNLSSITIVTLEERMMLAAMLSHIKKIFKEFDERKLLIEHVIERKDQYEEKVRASISKIQSFLITSSKSRTKLTINTVSELIDELDFFLYSKEELQVKCERFSIAKVEKFTYPRLAVISLFAKTTLTLKYERKFKQLNEKELGSGTYGKVQLVNCCGILKALKTPSSPENAEDLVKGAVLVSQLFAKNYFASVDWFSDDEIYMDVGVKNLAEIMHLDNSFLHSNMFILAEDLVSAVAVMHEQNVLHADLSLRNILLFADQTKHSIDGRSFRFKICDFDSVKPAKVRHKIPGTYVFLAPEMFQSETRCLTPTKESNCWSIGIILLYVLKRGFLTPTDFSGENMRMIYESINQEFIDLKLEKLRNKSEKLHFNIGLPFFEDYLKELGREEAQRELINCGKSRLHLSEKKDEVIAKIADGEELQAHQILLDIGIDFFIEKNDPAELIRFFIRKGKEIYLRDKSEADYDRAVAAIGEEKLHILIDMISALLRINPKERASTDQIFDRFFMSQKLMPDREDMAKKNYSFLELN